MSSHDDKSKLDDAACDDKPKLDERQRSLYVQTFGGDPKYNQGYADALDNEQERILEIIDQRIAAYEQQRDDAGEWCRYALTFLRTEIVMGRQGESK